MGHLFCAEEAWLIRQMGLLFFIRAEETGTWDVSSDNATWDTSSDNTTWDTSSFFVPKREEAQPVVFEVLFLHFYDMGHLFCTGIRHGTPLLVQKRCPMSYYQKRCPMCLISHASSAQKRCPSSYYQKRCPSSYYEKSIRHMSHVSHVLWVMSPVLWVMSHVLWVMSPVLWVMSPVLWVMSHVLWVRSPSHGVAKTHRIP